MSNYPKTLEDRARLYLHCMVEIKERLRLIPEIVAVDTSDLFKNEICSLQFRHICELLAVACLAAQGDFQTQRAFREEYSPQKIFNALRIRFPNFFPLPTFVTMTPVDGGSSNHHHVEVKQDPGTLNENGIVEMWSRSGDDLHRLSVKKYLKRTFAPPPRLELVVDRVQALGKLLNTHLIPIGDPEDMVFLEVRMEDGGGNAVAHFITLDQEKGVALVLGFQAKVVAP